MNDLIAKLTAQLWAMEPVRLTAFVEMLARLDARSEEARKAYYDEEDLDETPEVPEIEIRDGVAHIAVCGPILKEANWFLDYFGIAYTSTMRTAEMVARAADDPSVRAIVLDVDSPGGTVEGVDELAVVIREARNKRPISAHISGLGASAAYWIAAQANDITATHTTLVGSIGVYSVIADWSRFYESQGVKVHVVSSHELKGAGVQGSKITEAQLADAKRLIDQFTDLFVGAIVEGRGMDDEKVRVSATGQVWMGDDAIERGLIDSIATAEQAHASAAGSQFLPSAQSAHHQEGHMAQPQVPAVPPQGDSVSAENEELKKKLAAAEAREAVQAASIKEIEAGQKRELIEAAVADGRVTPPMRAIVDSAAEKNSIAELKTMLAGLPKQTRPSAISTVAPQGNGETKTEGDLNEQEALVCKQLGISQAAFKEFGDVASMSLDGKTLTMRDGSVRERKVN